MLASVAHRLGGLEMACATAPEIQIGPALPALPVMAVAGLFAAVGSFRLTRKARMVRLHRPMNRGQGACSQGQVLGKC